MFCGRPTFLRLKLIRSQHFCTNTTKPTPNNSNKHKIESSITRYNETYRQLDNLDFMTATKILFNEPPKQKKFGLDFHLVQLFFVCLPSLAVYLVAQYARKEMKKMDAELEVMKKSEEEKAKELEEKAIKEREAKAHPELLEVKGRLDKLEEAIKEIAVESKKRPGDNATRNQDDGITKKQIAPIKPGDSQSTSESRESTEKALLGKPPPSTNTSQQHPKSKAINEGTSEATRI
ncbi:uncharacterized protein LOC126680971 [Mercurialis annua]|uniref:uncharacterized protein LOC126680971 n=1 Tax=Mercurialis annua TaxID=3986 RepID=UPI002160F4BD|nr:uncharacterized protein LOC126680971 [Mercurialis annua]